VPAIGFICPDNDRCLFAECFEKCRIADQFPAQRCMALRNLRMIADQREWNGKPSCTQLLKGTREAYLEITKDYYINPQDAVFRIIGTKAHSELDKFTGENELGEIRLELEGITGAFDYMDEEGNLYDTKSYGSYRTMLCLGYQSVDVPTGEYFKTGPRKGQEKTHKEIVQGEPELAEQSLQLNLYRMMLENCGFPIKKLFLDINVRDGGIRAATSRGITQNAYLIEVPKMDNQSVLDYFIPKRDALLWAVEGDIMPEPCSEETRWNGRKCQGYCNVWESCDIGREMRGGINCQEQSISPDNDSEG
jgi:hypothetical protein